MVERLNSKTEINIFFTLPPLKKIPKKNILRQTLHCSAKLQFFPPFRSFGGIDTDAGRRKKKAEFMSYTSGILSKNLRHLLPSGAASNLATIIPYSSIV